MYALTHSANICTSCAVPAHWSDLGRKMPRMLKILIRETEKKESQENVTCTDFMPGPLSLRVPLLAATFPLVPLLQGGIGQVVPMSPSSFQRCTWSSRGSHKEGPSRPRSLF